MPLTARGFPPMPELGHSEAYYAQRVREADRYHDRYAHDAYKVGQYVTLARIATSWERKEQCYRHVLKHQCHAPYNAPEDASQFYGQLAQLVRESAGMEAMKVASQRDDEWAARLAAGEPRLALLTEASNFFAHMLPGSHRPEWCNACDYQELKILQHVWS